MYTGVVSPYKFTIPKCQDVVFFVSMSFSFPYYIDQTDSALSAMMMPSSSNID